jgi:hypothetical protein
MVLGRLPRALVMEACTSMAALSMSLPSSNMRVTVVRPWLEVELMASKPAMAENWRSRGEATLEAMVLGLAPGSTAFTWMTGKSTVGR